MKTITAASPITIADDASLRARRMKSFHPAYRRYVQQLSSCSRQIEDLADTFPAMLFALSTGYGTPESRAASFSLIQSGASLKDAASELGLPFWLRRLPASSFTEPLSQLPDTPEFSRRIAPLIPELDIKAKSWLWAVNYANLACGPEFALWTANWIGKQNRHLTGPYGEENFRFLTAWAWHSGKPLSAGYDLLRRAWTPSIGPRRAIEETAVWRRRIALALAIHRLETTNWLQDGNALGFEFVALCSPQDFIRESEAMDNCLDQFADRLEQNQSKVFSIRKNGRSVANVEIGNHDQEVTMPCVLQLRAPRNRRASAEIWQATYAWLGTQTLRPRYSNAARPQSAIGRQAAKSFWQDYIDHLEPNGLADAFAAIAITRRRSRTTIVDISDLAAQPPTRQRNRARARPHAGTTSPPGT